MNKEDGELALKVVSSRSPHSSLVSQASQVAQENKKEPLGTLCRSARFPRVQHKTAVIWMLARNYKNAAFNYKTQTCRRQDNGACRPV